MRERFTIITDGMLIETDAAIEGDAIRILPDTVRDALGWELKPQGLCKADRCIPTQAQPSLLNADGIDLIALARLLGQPLALDRSAGAACIGESARARSEQLAMLRAPEFTLPDLEGRPHSLSDYRGQRVLLVTWASW